MQERNGLYSLVLIEISKDYKSIFNLTSCGLIIEVEALRKRTDVTKCHRCQWYEHVKETTMEVYGTQKLKRT